MQVAHTIDELHATLGDHARPSFVPTMGNLHEGHIELVRLARAQGMPTICSIFVNRLQFAPTEDFDSYPRTLDQDLAALEAAGCDVVFVPRESELYPIAQSYAVSPDADLAGVLEGAFRPGSFTGVCTVVMKLFNCVRPSIAVFGEKDYQQLLIITRMVSQFCMDIRVLPAPIQRCIDGLAHSSRNAYLGDEERREAPRLYSVLRQVESLARRRDANFEAIERHAVEVLRSSGWSPDYVAIRDSATLGSPRDRGALVVLAAARLGRTRLIDNLRFQPFESIA